MLSAVKLSQGQRPISEATDVTEVAELQHAYHRRFPEPGCPMSQGKDSASFSSRLWAPGNSGEAQLSQCAQTRHPARHTKSICGMNERTAVIEGGKATIDPNGIWHSQSYWGGRSPDTSPCLNHSHTRASWWHAMFIYDICIVLIYQCPFCSQINSLIAFPVDKRIQPVCCRVSTLELRTCLSFVCSPVWSCLHDQRSKVPTQGGQG